METLPALNASQLPAYMQGREDASSSLVASLLVGAPTSVPRISLKQGRFRIREGQDEFVLDQLFLDTVIVGAVPGVSKMFYIKPWNPGDEPTAPDCHSVLGVKPEADSVAPQNDICATCPKNQWGSKLTPQGTEIKACSDSRRIAVVPADDPTKTYLMVVPAASMRNLTKYVKDLTMRGYEPDMVRTRLTFDAAASYPLLQFAFAGFVAEQLYPKIQEKKESVDVQDVLGMLGRSSAPRAVGAKKVDVLGPPLTNPAEMNPTPAPVLLQQAKPNGFGGTTTAPAVEVEAPSEAPKRRGRPPKADAQIQQGMPSGFGNAAPAQPIQQAPVSSGTVSGANSMADLEAELDSLLK